MNAPHAVAGRTTSAPVMPKRAALPMYDLPELAQANDALWAVLARSLREAGVQGVPARLSRGAPLMALWTDPELLLAQACGYPVSTVLAGRVQIVSTPRYSAEGCNGAFHRSAIVVRLSDPAQVLADLAGRRVALNDPMSGTGMNLLRALIAPLADGQPFFDRIEVTGSHLASAEAVSDGSADLASIDCVTWAHLQRLRPALTARLRVLTWSAQTPGLPLITTRRTSGPTLLAIARALSDASRDPGLKDARRELLLDGFGDLPDARLLSAGHWSRFAADLGYSELR